MISAIILNWKRPENLRQIISDLDSYGCIGEIIVWDNYGTLKLPNSLRKTSLIQSNRDFSLFTRFAAASLANSESILFQDDDILLPESTVASLERELRKDPEVIHGIFGRKPREKNGQYAKQVLEDKKEAPIILTVAMTCTRTNVIRCLAVRKLFDSILKQGSPYGNGEDILISYVAQKYSGRMNMVHDLAYKKLRSPYGISERWIRHSEYRTVLMHACQKWISE